MSVDILENQNIRLEELTDFFHTIRDKLTKKEEKRMKLELALVSKHINEAEHFQVSKKLVKLLNDNNIVAIDKDINNVLNRMYDIAGFGCKTSCISSSNIILETEKILIQKDSDSYEFISVKGHIAPFLYANKYVKNSFSLLYLYALHYSNIISPIVDSNYTSEGVTASYNLGYGLGKVLSMMMKEPHKKFIVMIGDSDLSFGPTLEALMYIKSHNLNNLTLLVDFNRFGFEARPNGFDTTVLRSFFDRTIEVDEHNLKKSSEFKDILFSSSRSAVFINTKKENHRITLFSSKEEPKNIVRLTKEYGRAVANLNRRYQKELLIFTPDLASRFFLQENNLTYINTTVSEALTPILAIEQDRFTAIATDQKYATNMIGSFLELYKNTASVVLTLAKSWDYWGGEANALNLLNTLHDVTVYEPCSQIELNQLLESHYIYPLYKTIISIADVELPKLEFKPNLRRENQLIDVGSTSLIISFGIATALIYGVAKEMDIDLIHFAKMRIAFDEKFQEKLNSYEHIYFIEYNGRRNGFSESFLSVYNISSYTIKTAQDEIPKMKASEQIAYHGFSTKMLKLFLQITNT